MKLLLAIVIILVISLIGSRLTFFNRRLSLGFKNIMLTGTEYIIIGALLGIMGLGILDSGSQTMLEPFLVVGLCWIGFLFGLQFDWRQLKNLARNYFYISAMQALVTFIFIGIAMFYLLQQYTNYPRMVQLMLAIVLASAAAGTGQSALAIVNKSYKFKNRRLLDLMRYISGLDGIYALLFFGMALSIFPGAEIASFGIVNSLKWVIVSIAMGIIPALILISLSRVRFSEQEFLVFVVGTIMFCGGLAHQIHYSPLISGLLCGVVTANFCRHSVRALSVVMHAEKSLYIIILLLLGASWDFTFKIDYVLMITAIYFLLRILGKYIGAFLGTKIFKPDYAVPSGLGLGLISDGGLSVAIIIDAKLLFPSLMGPFITIVIISVLLNELLSPWMILGRFKKEDRYRVDGTPTAPIDIGKLKNRDSSSPQG
jgi:Kef-type K+ transport system membrane component KefB